MWKVGNICCVHATICNVKTNWQSQQLGGAHQRLAAPTPRTRRVRRKDNRVLFRSIVQFDGTSDKYRERKKAKQAIMGLKKNSLAKNTDAKKRSIEMYDDQEHRHEHIFFVTYRYGRSHELRGQHGQRKQTTGTRAPSIGMNQFFGLQFCHYFRASVASTLPQTPP